LLKKVCKTREHWELSFPEAVASSQLLVKGTVMKNASQELPD